jgi:hypothetical protein
MGTHWPTSMCWRLGTRVVALGVAEVVQQVIAVEAGTEAADLHQPWPNGVRRRVDGYRPRCFELGVRQELVPGQRVGDFDRCGPPIEMSSPVERRGQEGWEIVGDIEDLGEEL